MRKYILSTVFFSIGLILLLLSVYKNKNTVYKENVFSNESTSFEKTFSSFLTQVHNNIKNIESGFDSPEKLKDTAYIHNYFIKKFSENPYLKSIAILRNNFKIGIKKDKNSFVFTTDSTEAMDVVTWKRYENGKYLSSWEESFNVKIKTTQWYKDIYKEHNKIRWYFHDTDTIQKHARMDKDLFYIGYSYKSKGVPNVILMGISRSSVIKSFDHFSKIDSLSLIIGNTQDQYWKLNSENPYPLLEKGKVKTDSISYTILQHFKKFNHKEKGIFNFNLKGKVFWNSFKMLPPDSGLKNYIFTLPEYQLLSMGRNEHSEYLLWASVILIFTGLLLLLIKKRSFYFPKKVSIPPLSELLREDENRYLEFKSSCRWDYRQEKYNPELENVISKTIAAFCNTDGGTLLIGVDDDKNLLGLEKDFATLKKSTPDYYEIHLRNILHKLMGVKNVSKNIRIAFESIDQGKTICKVKVLASSEPVFIKIKDKNGNTKEKFYVRSGNSSQEIESIVEINDYINSRFKK